jgi:predicted alpha/beta hydrolase family esterase
LAYWAGAASKKADHIDGAFLAAPAWLTKGDECPAQLADLLLVPIKRLLFSIFVTSEEYPCLPIEIA